MMMTTAAFVAWPDAPLTNALVTASVTALSVPVLFALPARPPPRLVQWASYDAIDHALTLSQSTHVLSSSYIIRKALIRKHFLARSVQSYLLKRPGSPLADAVPLTWDIDIAYADELDEMWSDELWDLGSMLDASPDVARRWFILKPAMADRGMGIRLFDSKQALLAIFQDFDRDDDDDDDDDDDQTSVVTSQLRHFVLQEYVSTPLLVDPIEAPLPARPYPSPRSLKGHKFHLRTYVVASGALTVFMYERILALFSAEPYHPPMRPEPEQPVPLASHLTNTSLQSHLGEENVRLLDELVGCHILSAGEDNMLSTHHVALIKQQIADTLAETFKAALDQPIHFQPLPNAFELYGVDFLVSHEPAGFQIKLLEMNSEPAIELTGPRLTWILQELFNAIGIVCIQPFLHSVGRDGSVPCNVGETIHNLRKCLDLKVHASM